MTAPASKGSPLLRSNAVARRLLIGAVWIWFGLLILAPTLALAPRGVSRAASYAVLERHRASTEARLALRPDPLGDLGR